MQRSVRKRADRVIMRGVEVMYKKKNKEEVRIIQSREEQLRILEMCHSDPTSGHFGVKKTFNRVRERFYWKGMCKDAEELVRSHRFYVHLQNGFNVCSHFHIRMYIGEKCRHCQMMNKKANTARPELHPIPVKSPWYHLGINFIGPYSPPSASGNKYVLTVSDYFTKFVWVKQRNKWCGTGTARGKIHA